MAPHYDQAASRQLLNELAKAADKADAERAEQDHHDELASQQLLREFAEAAAKADADRLARIQKED